MATKAFNITGGELSLVNAALSSTEWEGVLRRLMNESSQLHVRSLKLDDNDLGGERLDAAIGEAIPRLDLLTDLSICDARLAGPATHRLLEALGSVPAFARTHAEVWAPIPTVVQPPQGARLCLMRNSIAAADLTPPGDAPITPLRGVLILALSGNQLLGDGGVVALSTLAPSLRKLYLGKCGVTLGAKGGVPALFERCWPMLEALALYDNPLVQGVRSPSFVDLRDLRSPCLSSRASPPRQQGVERPAVEAASSASPRAFTSAHAPSRRSVCCRLSRPRPWRAAAAAAASASAAAAWEPAVAVAASALSRRIHTSTSMCEWSPTCRQRTSGV